MSLNDIKRIKRADWINLESNVPWYGIKCQTHYGQWFYMAENGKGLLYPTPEERDAKMREIRKRMKEVEA